MTAIQPDERAWHFKQLRHSLQQLAASGSSQAALFPDLMLSANELALNFDHWATLVRDEYDGELTGAQRGSLAALDGAFARMSQDAAEFDADIWTDAAMKTSAHWTSIRQLAGAALEAFGWTPERSPTDSPDSDPEVVR